MQYQHFRTLSVYANRFSIVQHREVHFEKNLTPVVKCYGVHNINDIEEFIEAHVRVLLLLPRRTS